MVVLVAGYSVIDPYISGKSKPDATRVTKVKSVETPSVNTSEDPAYRAANLTIAPEPASVQKPDAALEARFRNAKLALVARDPKSIEQITALANEGFAPAQNELGMIYEGQVDLAKLASIRTDKALARQWYQRAANGGHTDAMHNLAMLMYGGEGGPIDTLSAARWFRKAAEIGYGPSQFNIANLYERGAGVPQDFSIAYRWYMIAAMGGDKEAAQRVQFLRSQLLDVQRKTAELDAKTFVNAHGSAQPTVIAAKPEPNGAQ